MASFKQLSLPLSNRKCGESKDLIKPFYASTQARVGPMKEDLRLEMGLSKVSLRESGEKYNMVSNESKSRL